MKSYKLTSLLALIAFVGLTALYQNCSQQNGSPVDFKFISAAAGGGTATGNGDYYDGKPEPGIYDRLLPDRVCGGENAPFGRLNIETQRIRLEKTNPLTCSADAMDLSPSALEYSKYNPRYIGYGEGVFVKRTSLDPVAILPEVWCRRPGSSYAFGLDVVVEVERATGLMRSTLLAEAGSIAPAVDVQRTRTGQQLRYVGGDYSLTVDIAEKQVKSPGRLIAMIQGKSVDEKLDCRLAGAMDPGDPFPAGSAVQPQPLPGKVEIESYDNGGEGVGFHDTTPGDSGGANPRGDDVDVVSIDGGLGVSDMAAGEWLRYTVEVASSGVYEIVVGVDSSAVGSTPAFHIEIDGVNVTGMVSLPNSKNPGTYPHTTLPNTFSLKKGIHQVRLVVDGQGFAMSHMLFNLKP